RIVTKTLRKPRNERYQTIQELAADLALLKHELEVDARLARSSESGREVRPNNAARTLGVGPAQRTSRINYLGREVTRYKYVAALAAIALLMIAAAYVYLKRRNVGASESLDSIAVLPFVNVNNDPTKEYLTEGICDSVINSLSQLPGLKVMSLNSVLR